MESGEQPPKVLTFIRQQEIVQKPGETSEQLHERLRPRVLMSFVAVDQPTILNTPSWYTFDPSKIISDIPNTVVISTSTCKHEPPFTFFVGRREEGWMEKVSEDPERFRYKLEPLGRELTLEEKSAIYDSM